MPGSRDTRVSAAALFASERGLKEAAADDNYRDPPLNATLEGKIMIGLVEFGSYPELENETAAQRKVWCASTFQLAPISSEGMF